MNLPKIVISAARKVISTLAEVRSALAEMISAATEMISASAEAISATLKMISANAETISARLKVPSANAEILSMAAAMSRARLEKGPRSSTRREIIIAGVFVATALSPAVAQNLVTNPGFELPGFSLNPNYRFLNGGNATLLTNWTFAYDGVQEPSYVYHRSRYPVFAGNYAVQMGDGDGCSTIVTTDVGCGYVLSITFIGDDGGTVRFQAGDLDVAINPASTSSGAVGTGVFLGAVEWRRLYLPFNAISVQTTIAIGDFAQGRPFGGRVYDDISVVRGVAIVASPQSRSTCPSGSASFSVTAAGSGPFAYQWQHEFPAGVWFDIDEGVNVNMATAIGVATPTLHLADLGPIAPGAYRCVVSNACGVVTSNAATLTICIADTDDGTGTGVCDGGVTIDDLLYYLGIFDQGLVAADVDDGSGTGTPDGGVTIEDLLYYLARFDAGC